MTTEKLNDCTKIPGAVSRRSFLFGLGATAAVVAGGGLAGCAPQGSDAAPAAATSADAEAMAATGSATSDLTTDTVQDALAKPAKNQESKEADIVVVGSGIAGMSCAVEAALAGAKEELDDDRRRLIHLHGQLLLLRIRQAGQHGLYRLWHGRGNRPIPL